MKPTPELIGTQIAHAAFTVGCFTLAIAAVMIVLGLVAACWWPGWSPVEVFR